MKTKQYDFNTESDLVFMPFSSQFKQETHQLSYSINYKIVDVAELPKNINRELKLYIQGLNRFLLHGSFFLNSSCQHIVYSGNYPLEKNLEQAQRIELQEKLLQTSELAYHGVSAIQSGSSQASSELSYFLRGLFFLNTFA